MRIPIIDSSLHRDMGSRGLVETDRRKIDDYKLKSKMMTTAASTRDEINNIKEKLGEIDNLKSDMQEIKSLLKNLVNKE
jgi:hypothetical protein